ncbi:BatA domain-containing protein [Fibrella forsythiae]|uniref:BatA domain-containing protein n=1 Tax=Fibrella forsythiae TaxID=2817061 RepID=A0ABS3JNY8_9BACT|nr:BatA domain-containing protein [Fibrella forsythiae]MBO0951713.1 BatA domain-containing protein [Fibrella forsythiae]
MLFQHPSLLWGLLTVAVPIALHFWHQQQAKPMPWAMLRWLETPNQPPKRGFRFDNWLLLLVRCLLLIALTLLLARPSFKKDETVPVGRKVHLVEPNTTVTNAYRFELEQALAKKERVMWATTPVTPVVTLTELPSASPPNPLQWQTAINELTEPAIQLHTYLSNDPEWVEAPRLHVPAGFMLHTADVPAKKTSPRYVALPSGKQLAIGTDDRLGISTAGSASAKAVATAPLRVLLQFRKADERNTVQAALGAITAVYGLPFRIDNQSAPGVTYAWVLTDRPVATPTPGTLYTITGQSGNSDRTNIGYVPEPLTPQTSDWVTDGQLPEWLAGQLITHLGLSAGSPALPRSQLAGLFVADKSIDAVATAAHPVNWLQTGLLLLFLGLLLVERYLAIQRQA